MNGSSPAKNEPEKGGIAFPMPIVKIVGLSNCVRYIGDPGHKRHLSSTVSGLGFHIVDGVEDLLRMAEERLFLIKHVILELEPRKWNREIAEHLIVCPPPGVELTEKERELIVKRVLEKLGDGYAAVYSWHNDEDREHCHFVILNLHKDFFWVTREASIRVVDGRGDYFEYVRGCLRDIESELNVERDSGGCELIPSLTAIRHNKRIRTGEGEPFRPFVEELADTLNYWISEGDDDAFLGLVKRTAIDEMRWKVERVGEKSITVIPPQKKKEYTMPLYHLKGEIRRMFLEQSQSFKELEEDHLDAIAEAIGPLEYETGPQVGEYINDELGYLGYHARATDVAVEALSPRGGLYRMSSERFVEFFRERFLRNAKARAKAFVLETEILDQLTDEKWQSFDAVDKLSGRERTKAFFSFLEGNGCSLKREEDGRCSTQHDAISASQKLYLSHLFIIFKGAYLDHLRNKKRKKEMEKFRKSYEEEFRKNLQALAQVLAQYDSSEWVETAGRVGVEVVELSDSIRMRCLYAPELEIEADFQSWKDFESKYSKCSLLECDASLHERKDQKKGPDRE